MSFDSVDEREPLRLLRSYDIPRDDPLHARLLNVSWSYDSALGAIAFDVAGERRQAEQLLDQLKALQRTDGSIEHAYEVYTGASADMVRSGTVAWTGLAAAVHGTDRYRPVAEGAARWLVAHQRDDGLVRGGPDVTWVSTHHNLVAWLLLRTLALDPRSSSRATWDAAADRVESGIDAKLLVRPGSGPAYFVQGLNDPVRALDAQTLGILHLLARGRLTDALRVRESLLSDYPLGGRSLALSSDPDTYNATYRAAGPFSGFRPYPGADVLWTEGTAQARLALALLGGDVRALDASIRAWSAVTSGRGEGPLAADRTVVLRGLNQYHVWPSAAAAGWTVLAFGGGGEELLEPFE